MSVRRHRRVILRDGHHDAPDHADQDQQHGGLEAQRRCFHFGFPLIALRTWPVILGTSMAGRADTPIRLSRLQFRRTSIFREAVKVSAAGTRRRATAHIHGFSMSLGAASARYSGLNPCRKWSKLEA